MSNSNDDAAADDGATAHDEGGHGGGAELGQDVERGLLLSDFEATFGCDSVKCRDGVFELKKILSMNNDSFKALLHKSKSNFEASES